MDRKISELDQVLNLDEQAEFPLSQDNGGTPTTFKAKLTQLAAKIAEAITFSNLITNDKHIIGAINEAAQGSGASMKFEDLNDVDIDNLQNGQFSKYDSTTEKWKNTTIQESDVANLVSDLADKADKTDLVYEKTASGSIATFTDGGDDIPVSEYECDIVAQQASGTPTPTSPLPITGFSQADIVVCGINLWNEQWELADFDNQGNRISGNYVCSKAPIKIKPNTSYYFHSGNANGKVYVYYYDSNMNYLTGDNFNPNTTFTTPNNAVYVNFLRGSAYGTTYNNDVSINYPATDTQYHAYKGNLYTVAFGQTIYGGKLVYKNGQWSIEATHQICDFGDFTWTRWTSGSDALFYNTISDKINDVNNYLLCSCLEPIHDSATGLDVANILLTNDNTIIASKNTTQPRFMVRCNTYTDANTFKTALTGQKVVYELATPIIIPITSATRVKTISGVNNIFSNTGDNSVKYFTENADSLAELIKASESESTGYYHEYSTEEKIVGKWIDGKTLYEKTVDHTFTSGAQSYTVFASGIDIAFAHTYMVEYSANRWLSMDVISKANVNNMVSLQVERDANGALILSEVASTAHHWIAVIRYTKTSSNTRSLNLSKGVEEKPIEEKTDEIKTEEVKEEEKNAEQNER